jgi:ABC-2 type transport system permease protein
MNLRIVRALAAKDLSLFLRNRFYALVTALGLVMYIVIYAVMPGSVDETLLIGVYGPESPPVIEQMPGLEIEGVESEEALIEAVIQGRYEAGMVLPEGITDGVDQGRKPEVTLYFRADAPEELRGAVEFLMRELAHQLAGEPLAVETSVEILGRDTLGEHIPTRDRMIPLFAVALIMFESLALATLITEEVETGTARALLVTPVRVRDLFAAKGLLGVGLAFSQAALFMAIVGGLSSQPLLVLATLLLGAVMVTGLGFLVASVAKDMMSVMAWGFVVLIVFTIPTFAILFPGAISDWIKLIPSYYLADMLHQAVNFDAGWGEVWPNLLILLGFDLALVWGGIRALRRSLQ